MVDGKQPEDTEGDMKLSMMKPLSARWLSLLMTILELQCSAVASTGNIYRDFAKFNKMM